MSLDGHGCLDYTESGTPWGDDSATYYSPDLRATALDSRIATRPMTTWLYNNYIPLLMGLVIEQATGQSVSQFAQTHLWSPMGAEHDASWSLDSEASGFEKLESGFNAVLRDWGRFGLLALHHGRFNGTQIASAPFWELATRPQVAAGSTEPLAHDYWLWWWLDEDEPGVFVARGNLGQFIYVDPASRVVITRFGEELGIDDWPSVLTEVAETSARLDADR